MITVGDNLVFNRGGLSSMVDAFAARVEANGGTALTAGQKAILTTFYNGLGTDGILTKMTSMCCFLPGAFSPAVADADLIRACTPLIVGPGNDPWTNNAFVAGDLTVAGLAGNGSSKFLQTGIVPTTAIASDASIGVSVYNLSAANASTYEVGARSSAGSVVDLLVSYGDSNAYFECWDEANATGKVVGSNALWTGLLSGNRVPGNVAYLFRANGSVAPEQLATSSGTPIGTRPSHEIFVFAYNNAGSAAGFSARRLSFVAFHTGLVLADFAKLFARVQALRAALGGGYV